MVERKIREEFARALEERDGDVINRILSSIDEESADELLKDVWNTSTGKEYGGNAGSAFDEFKERIYGKRRNSGLSRTIAWISSAAAVIAIALCLFLALKPNHSVTRWAEMTTGYGKMDSLVLQDGTKIWTNAGTTLIYPEKFDGKERHVYVSGEAFFSVAKDPKHPFIVTAEGVNVRVLGTKFNVKAYNDESDVVTTLVTGSIQLTTPVSDSIYKLQPNKTLVFDRENGSVECYLNKEYNLPMWYCDELNFNNITLDEISRELERRFKVKIVLRNPKCASLRFYASFVNGENVDDILSSLNVKNEFRIVRKDDVIDIY